MQTIYLRVSRIYTPRDSVHLRHHSSPYAPVAQSVSIIPVSPYTRRSSVLCQAEWRWWWETDFSAITPPWPLMRSTPLLFRITVYANPKEHKNTTNPMGRHRRRLWRKNTNVDLKEKKNINVDPKEKPWTQWKAINQKENHKTLTPCAPALSGHLLYLPSFFLDHLRSTRCGEAEYRIELSPHAWHTRLLWSVPGLLWPTRDLRLPLAGR